MIHRRFQLALAVAVASCTFGSMARAEELMTQVVSAELGRRYDKPLLLKAASDESPLVRAAAARAAGRLRRTEAIEWLLPMMNDSEGRVRRAALFALGQIGGPDILIPVRESMHRLQANDLAVALDALGKSQDPRAVAATLGLLQHDAPAVRQAAALALFRLGDVSTVAELVGALLLEQDAEARWRQIYAISRLLRARVETAKAPVRADPAWVAPLRAATDKDRPFFERGFAARALGALEGQSEFLLALTGDSDPRVVISAIRGLATDTGAAHADALVALLANQDELVREAVLDALERWGERAQPAWTRALPQLTGRLRMRALLALAAAGDVRAPAGQFDKTAEREALEEEYAWSLVPFLQPDAARPRPDSLKSVDAMRAAATVCGDEKVALPWATDVLRALLAVDDFTVQSMAIGALAQRGAKTEVPLIVKAARNAGGVDWMDVRLEAAGALALLGVYDPWLDEAAIEANPFVRDAARAALEKLDRPLPPTRPPGGFQLVGEDAGAVLNAAADLAGARIRLKTNRGVLTMVLLPDEAPAHCVNIAQLVARGFYDGKSWHRVVANFVIQGGCPRGDGWGGPGYTLPDEIGMRPYVRGTVGMPKSGDDTGGCQIFITHLPTPHLDGRYTVFAQVIEGFDVLDRIRVGDRIEQATLEVREKQ